MCPDDQRKVPADQLHQGKLASAGCNDKIVFVLVFFLVLFFPFLFFFRRGGSEMKNSRFLLYSFSSFGFFHPIPVVAHFAALPRSRYESIRVSRDFLSFLPLFFSWLFLPCVTFFHFSVDTKHYLPAFPNLFGRVLQPVSAWR